MKIVLSVLQAIVLTSVLLTFVGVFTKHIILVQVKEPRVVNVVDDQGKVLFPWVTGEDVSYEVVFTK